MASDSGCVDRRLYSKDGVLAARTRLLPPGLPEVTLLVEPRADLAAVEAYAREVVEDELGVRGEDVTLRIVPLGGIAMAPSVPSAVRRSGTRIRLGEVLGVTVGGSFRADVVVERSEVVVAGRASGATGPREVPGVVASATVDAIGKLEPRLGMARVESAEIVKLGSTEIAVTVLAVVRGGDEELLAGSAPVRAHGEMEAVARAVLDTLNRRVERAGREI